MVVEVYDPARLERTLEWAVERINQGLTERGAQGFTLESFEQAGRTYHELKSLDTGISAHYLFVDGYMIASASRALLDRALEVRATGTSLASSASFTSLLPYDSQPNFSAVVYQDWGSIVRPLAKSLPGNPEHRQGSPGNSALAFVETLGSLTGPSLMVAYGEERGITLINNSEGGLLGRGLASILSVRSLLGMQELVDQAVQDEADGTSDETPSDRESRVRRAVSEG
jgi:hypothetical protein